VLMVSTSPGPERGSAPVPPDWLLRGVSGACRPVSEGQQMMTPEEEYAFYAEAKNQEPQGPARKRWPTRLNAPGAGTIPA
jgi:hypothetical protein